MLIYYMLFFILNCKRNIYIFFIGIVLGPQAKVLAVLNL